MNLRSGRPALRGDWLAAFGLCVPVSLIDRMLSFAASGHSVQKTTALSDPSGDVEVMAGNGSRSDCVVPE